MRLIAKLSGVLFGCLIFFTHYSQNDYLDDETARNHASKVSQEYLDEYCASDVWSAEKPKSRHGVSSGEKIFEIGVRAEDRYSTMIVLVEPEISFGFFYEYIPAKILTKPVFC